MRDLQGDGGALVPVQDRPEVQRHAVLCLGRAARLAAEEENGQQGKLGKSVVGD